MTDLNRFAPDTPPDHLGEAIERDGFCIVERLVDEARLERLHVELQPHLDAARLGHEAFMGSLTRRFGALIGKAQSSHDLLLHPTVIAMADRILRPHCVNYYVNYTGVMYLEPGEKAQILHRDTGIYPVSNPAPPFTLATMWALSDFTMENGATLIVPGSNHWPDERVPQRHEIAAAAMPAGSVLIYSGNTIHAGGANRAIAARYGLALHCTLGWLRQEENQFLALTLEEARKLPKPVQRIMGYELGSAHLGFVDHVDPNEFLNGTGGDGPSDLAPPELEEAGKHVRKLQVVAEMAVPRPRYEVEPDWLAS